MAILVFPRFNLYKRKSAGKRDMVACLSPISGLSSLNLYYYRASPGVATRHWRSACATCRVRTHANAMGFRY